MSGLRICMVTTFYPPFNFGGDGIAVQRLAQALVRRGHHVTVVHNADAYNGPSETGPDRAPTGADGVEVVTLSTRFPRLASLLTHQTGTPVAHRGTLRRQFASGRYDVINYHNVSLVGGPGVLAMGDAVKLYMAHEHWLVCPSHVLWRHNRELCTGRQCLRCVIAYKRPPQLWRYTPLLRRRLANIDAIIAASEFSRAKHQEFGLDRDMEVLPYFLPEHEAPPATGSRVSVHPKPYFLFVGRLERIKGLDDVIPRFCTDRDGPDLLIAGDGDYASALRTLARDHPRVRFLGRVPPAGLREYYHNALALIVPSACYETFGIILIEAFREGTPVIARRLGPFPEIVTTAGAGELFGTPAELDAAMARIENDPDYRDRASRAGRAAFSAHWSEAAVIPRYLDIIRRAALRRGHRTVADKLSRELAT